jgi:hypothetical protein
VSSTYDAVANLKIQGETKAAKMFKDNEKRAASEFCAFLANYASTAGIVNLT